MVHLTKLIEKIAATDAAVLILGETGVGKEFFARSIHRASPRGDKTFFKVDCTTIPENLIESELFGYVAGAFSGANVKGKPGLFEMADHGTLFLDEIGEMSPLMQVKLLRALQEKRVRAVGATEDHAIDARVLAATNQDLAVMVREKRFREDLFYRINVITLQIPPLRKRREDIPILARHFVQKISAASGRSAPSLTSGAMAVLEAYAWPGNIRELENVIERALALTPNDRIETAHLPESLLGYKLPLGTQEIEVPKEGFSLSEAVEGIRAAYIRRALELEDGVMVRAAKRLGMTFRSIRYFVKKYHLNAREDAAEIEQKV